MNLKVRESEDVLVFRVSIRLLVDVDVNENIS